MISRLVLLALCIPLAACGTLQSITPGGIAQGGQRFQGGFRDAATTPLEDLNIRRDEIPPVLLEARRAPYDLTGLGRCSALVNEIHQLEFVLGRDVDEQPESVAIENQAADAALSVVGDAAGDLIPLRSWVRRISGAHAHSQAVQQAIQAGIARRSYLKGVAFVRRCR